jgi:hypothetical protein
MYILQGKPDRHVTRIPRSIRVWSQIICISRDQRIATFHESPTDLDGSHYSREKRISDYILGTPADRSANPHPVSLLLSTKEVVGLRKDSVNGRLLGLPDPYLWYAIGTFNTCSWGPTHRSLTDAGRDYNHLRALLGLRLSNLNTTSSKSDVKHLSLTRGLSTTRRLPKSISTPNNCQRHPNTSKVIKDDFGR